MKFVKQRFCVSKLIAYLLLLFWFSRVFYYFLFIRTESWNAISVEKIYFCFDWISLSYELEIELLELTPISSRNWCDKPAGVSVSFSFSLAFLLDFGVKEFHNNLDTFSGLVVGLKVLLLWIRFLILVDGSGVDVFNCFLGKRFVTMIVFLLNFTFTSSGVHKRDFGFCFSLYFCFLSLSFLLFSSNSVSVCLFCFFF